MILRTAFSLEHLRWLVLIRKYHIKQPLSPERLIFWYQDVNCKEVPIQIRDIIQKFKTAQACEFIN